MPTSIREPLLARYHYDPLDRLVDSTPFEQSAIRRYYCKTRLATETQDSVQRSIVQHDDQLLTQQQHENGKAFATLLATDQQRSVLNALDATQPHLLVYTPYGHRPAENGLLSLLGFNGERPDPVTGHYHLGSGYRQFNPVLMRFNSPDSWSPFGEGRVNAYAYCGGEPMNRNDPSGHTWGPIKTFLRRIGVMKKPTKPANIVRVGLWEQVPGNPERVRIPSSTASKQKVKHPTKLTKKEEKQIRKELDKAVVEGRAVNQKGLNGTTGNPARSLDSAQNHSNTLSQSPFSNSVEHMSREELSQLESSVSNWRNVGTEKNNILNAVTREQNFRSLTIHNKPPISNREIRRGEPGYL